MTCAEFRFEFSRSLDGELPSDRVRSLEEHRRTCAECARVSGELSALDLALRDLPEADIPATLRTSLRELEERFPDEPAWMVPAKAAAGALAALLLLWGTDTLWGDAGQWVRMGILVSGYLSLALNVLDREFPVRRI